jgi:hypothetical protein
MHCLACEAENRTRWRPCTATHCTRSLQQPASQAAPIMMLYAPARGGAAMIERFLARPALQTSRGPRVPIQGGGRGGGALAPLAAGALFS